MRPWLLAIIAAVLLVGCADMPNPFKKKDAGVEQVNDPDAVQSATLDVVPEAKPTPDADPAAEASEPEPEEVAEPKPEAPDANAAARAKCVAGGGNFTKASGGFICVNRTRDANKSCTSSNQCQGACLARSGTCSPVVPLVGCHDIITDNGGMATLCID